jgi:uncharacterized protein YecT (DUF1311 family)
MRLRQMLLVSVLLGSVPARSATPDELKPIADAYDACLAAATSTVETKDCNAQAFDAMDAALNTTYKAVVTMLSDPKADEYARKDNAETLSRLKEAQRAWIPYRDAQCELEAAESLGGTGEGDIYVACQYQLTLERVNVIRKQFEDMQ